MNLDIRTLAIFLSITNLLQVISLYVQYRLDKTHRGLGWWTLGSAIVSIGFAANYLREVPVLGSMATVANNILFLSGISLLYIGILRFLDKRVRSGWLVAFCITFTLWIVYFTYIADDLAVRRVLISTAIAAMSFIVARVYFVNALRSITASAHFLATVFLINGIFFAVRALATLAGDPVDSPFNPTVMQTATYLITLIASTLWTFGFIILVNQRLNAENREAKENLELIFNTDPDSILITRLSDGRIVRVNDGFTALSGFKRAEVIGKSTLEVKIWQDPAIRQKFVAALDEKGFCENFEARFQRKDGSSFSGIVSAKLIDLQGATHIISVTHDITERNRLEEELRRQATTDELTGIFNRRQFLKLAEDELKRALRLKHPLAIVVIDIDRLKHINDTFGHAAGDQALLAFATRCQGTIREIDLFARFGGDEFALLLPETDCERARVAIERVRLTIIAHPIDVGEATVPLTVTAGIACLADAPESLDVLLGRADQAMYRAKAAGRNCVRVQSPQHEILV